MDSGGYGFSRECLDRFVQSQDSSVVNKFQKKYWKTKQTLIKVTGKKEDEHVVASDADLDAKLEVFHSVQRTCMELLKVIEQYQRRICCPSNSSDTTPKPPYVFAVLSQEENELGRFLRSQGTQDKSRAGKIMQATGKALCFSSQQRLGLRVPLCRLYQEVETFRYRAISDTWLTVNRMEQSRTEYRGALLWMKDVSQELDPDTHKQMEKFRKVQAQVRLTKSSFDKLKNDVCQKVDLLGASRCNLLSHVLTNYQTTLLHFWEKTSHTMAAIHESFKGWQPHELKMLQNKESDQGAKKRVKKKNKTKEEMEASPTTEDALISLADEEINNEATPGPEEALSCKGSAGGQEKEALTILSEILGSSSMEESEFSREWSETFGQDEWTELGGCDEEEPKNELLEPDQTSFFLPSQLLQQQYFTDLPSGISGWTVGNSQGAVEMNEQTASNQPTSKPAAKDTAEARKDLSAWFNLFADLDPLTNPDAVGKTDKEYELLKA